MTDEPQQRPGTHPFGGAPPPGPADDAGQRDARKRWALIAIGALCLCMLVAGISVAAFSSSGGPANHPAAGAVSIPQAGASGTPRATTPAPSSSSHTSTGQRVPATSKPAVAPHGLAKSALRYPKRLKGQILRWERGPGGRALAVVTAQMGYALQEAGTKLYPPMKLACTHLVSGINRARAGPAIPDAAMQRMYSRALAGLSPAAATCQQAISITGDGEDTAVHVRYSLLNLSRAEFAAGSKVLYAATADIRMP